jgi:membrane glycosyltransferase
LQHARLIVSRRIPLSNRFHFATGVMAFVSSPLWMLFVVISLAARPVHGIKASLTGMDTSSGAASWLAIAVFAAIMFMLVAPRIWGAIILCRNPQHRASVGGAGAVARSLLLEFGISVPIAPIMMAFHTLFIFSTLSGHRVQWGAQSRTESGVGLRQAWCVHRGQTIAGTVAAIAAALLAPESLFWLMPILAGLLLSIPISMAVSSAPFGSWFKRHGLLTIPEEVEPPAIVRLFDQARGKINILGCPPRAELFQHLLDDPLWLRSHFAMLESIAAAAEAPPAIVDQCKADIRLGRWSEMSNAMKQALLIDSSALTELHYEVWSVPGLQLAAKIPTIVRFQEHEIVLTEEQAHS